MIDMKWVDKLSEIYGVTSVILVDRDGLVITQAGEALDEVAPHSALMVKKLLTRIGVKVVANWIWTQCETESVIIGIANLDIGILVLLMEPDANIGMVRLEARNLRSQLRDEFSHVADYAS
ncbi:MAG: hypothetical protein P9L92_15700 [Candidatus Electryonea clarkiae]|nr:hypothetical protein [Candidatus Electryonea clarkiae]MDP8287269.1 hypothetical protein [Candidatus Electryonea clarkiae]